MKASFFTREKVPILFFVLYFFIGVFVFRDYGVSWDELYQDGIGQLNMRYVTGMDHQLLDARNPATFCAPIYEMFVVSTAKAFGINGAVFNIIGQASMYYRHFLNFITFFIGVIFFYFIVRHRFKSKYIGLLGALFLILTPRLFADAVYNSKDTVFLAFFVITFYAMLKFLEERTIVRLSLLAILTGITFSIRVGALFIPFFITFYLIGDYIFAGKLRKNLTKDLIQMFCYGCLTAYIIFVTYPVLWPNPIKNFLYILQFFGHFPTSIPNLYFGMYIPSGYLPWHFIPVWISITTPPVYIILFLTGLVGLFLGLKKNIKQFYLTRREDLLVLLWFFVPLVSVIIFRSTLYNSWRHMFFVYPAFILVAIHGVLYVKDFVQRHFKNIMILPIFYIFLFLNFIYVAKTMVDLHPYEHLYFNFLAGSDMKTVRKNFDTDYWGLTYRKGLEFIAKYDKRIGMDRVVVVADFPGYGNYFILPPKDASRMFVGFPWIYSALVPKYFMTNFFFSQKEPPYKEIYAVKVKGADILKVYELPESAQRFDGKFPYR